MFFSVIVPLYNKSSTINRAINSVLNQTFTDYELIIVNDGSTDNSLSEINKYVNFKNINIINQKNQGVSVARNTGILRAKGELITFLDPDDEWEPNHLESIYDVYKSCDKIDAIYFTCFKLILSNGNTINTLNEVSNKILDGDYYKVCTNLFDIYYDFKNGLIHTNSVMIPKKVFDKVGLFVKGLKRMEDIDMWCRVMIYYPAVCIGETTTKYHRDESSETAMITRSFNWPFINTAEKLLTTGKVRKEIEKSLTFFLDISKISISRHMIMYGKKMESIKLLSSVRCKKKYAKKLFVTYILFIFPSHIIKKIYIYLHNDYLNGQ